MIECHTITRIVPPRQPQSHNRGPSEHLEDVRQVSQIEEVVELNSRGQEALGHHLVERERCLNQRGADPEN